MGKKDVALNRGLKEQGRFHQDGTDGICKAEIPLNMYLVWLHIVQLLHEYTKNTMVQTDKRDRAMAISIAGTP